MIGTVKIGAGTAPSPQKSHPAAAESEKRALCRLAQPERGESGLEARSYGKARLVNFVNELESMIKIGGIAAGVPNLKNAIVMQPKRIEGAAFILVEASVGGPDSVGAESIAAPEFHGTSNVTSP
jgi:hypothetical protein